MSETVVGADLGGTSTRVVVASREGLVLGRGRAGAGNPVSSPATAAGALGEALGQAMAEAGSPRVGRVVLGVAGASALREGPVAAGFAAALAGCGVDAAPEYLPALTVAHAAGSPDPDGLVLIAGTGASAGVVRDHVLTRTAGGHGWLLGDEGAGFWLGREAVRALLADLDAGRPPGRLGADALTALVGDDGGSSAPGDLDDGERVRRQVVQAVHALAPVRLADLAPLVVRAAADGDPGAVDVVARAADALADLVLTDLVRTDLVRGVAPAHPVDLVVAGGLLGDGLPLRVALDERVARHGGVRVRTAGPGELGAAWLALGASPSLRAPLGLIPCH